MSVTNHSDLLEAVKELNSAEKHYEDCYKNLIVAVSKMKRAAQKLENIAGDLIKKPQINIGDFEIDG